MSPFELNKIAGAILFAALITISGWLVPSGIYHVDDSHGSVAYPLPGADEDGGAVTGMAGRTAAESQGQIGMLSISGGNHCRGEPNTPAILLGRLLLRC